jgi:Tol biopolymer transport system component
VIAYVSERDNIPGIHIMNADGSDQRRLTGGIDAHPDWSPDGRQIAFSTRPLGVVAISVYNLDDQMVHQLTDTDRSPSAPDWSPNSAQFAMVYKPSHPGINFELYLMSADGSKFVPLTDSAGYQFYANPDWSPDGKRIVFSADLEGNHDIYLMDPDGANVMQLTYDEAHDRSPAWSPDGSQIAFKTYREGNWEIYLMDADGTDLRNITNSAAREQWPAWSPDGAKIVFQSDRDGNWKIYVMDAGGSESRRLTNNDFKDTEPAWRP